MDTNYTIMGTSELSLCSESGDSFSNIFLSSLLLESLFLISVLNKLELGDTWLFLELFENAMETIFKFFSLKNVFAFVTRHYEA